MRRRRRRTYISPLSREKRAEFADAAIPGWRPEPFETASESEETLLYEFVDRLSERGREAVAEIVDRAEAADVATESVVRHGVPHAEILQYMDEADVGLAVIGSKNRSGEYRRLLGSVADRVVNMAERPVTIVKTAVDDE